MYTESRQPVFKLVTPKEAEMFLAINDFPGQRKYNPLKGKLYAENMSDGIHRRIDIAVVKVKEAERDYLMNGQHNCQAVLIHGKPYPAVVSYFVCDTMEEAWRLFATFDIHASRTEQQFMKSRRGLFVDERLHEVPLRLLQSCGSALYFLGNGIKPSFFVSSVHQKTEKADLVEKYSDEVMFVNQFKQYYHLLAIGAVTAIITTHRKNQRASFDFWDRVGSGAEMTVIDHRRKLRDSLLNLKFLDGTAGGSARQKVMYSLCIAWWNSWRKGEDRKSVKVNSMNDIPNVEG